MNIPLFDQTRKDELTSYGESVRLSNELRFIPAGNVLKETNIGTEYVWSDGRIWGFDVETADYSKLISYFSDNMIKKRSVSLIAFINRICAIRFSTEYTQDIDVNRLISMREFELIQSEAKNEVEWFGEVSYQNKVMLDGSLTNHNVGVITLNNVSVIIEKIQ